MDGRTGTSTLAAELADLDLAGLAGTFLGDLEPTTRARLIERASVRQAPAGTEIFSDRQAGERIAIVLDGLARIYLVGPRTRRPTVRYGRPGCVLGAAAQLVGPRIPIQIEAVRDCTLLVVERRDVIDLQMSAPALTAALLVESNRRLEEVYRTLASNVSGSIRERIATHLLELGELTPRGLVIGVSQTGIAEAVGTDRAVVARALAEFRQDGVVRTSREETIVLDPRRLVALADPWWGGRRLFGVDGGRPPEELFDTVPAAVVAIDHSGTVIYANPGVERTFQHTPEELIGRPVTTLMPVQVAAFFETALGAFLADVRSGPIGLSERFHGQRADGSVFPAEIELLPVRVRDRQVVFATVVDLTYRDRLREILGGGMAPREIGGVP